MRFLHTTTLDKRDFPSPSAAPPFAILSRRDRRPLNGHTSHDAGKIFTARPGGLSTCPFVQRACSVAESYGVRFICSFEEEMRSADVGHDAIHDYSSWLRECSFCIVFLSCDEMQDRTLEDRLRDVSTYWKDPWSLQELIFSKVEFFDFSGRHLASKSDVSSLLSRMSGVDEGVLRDPSKLQDVPLGTRISWFTGHDTIDDVAPEDTAYALAAVLGARMPVKYGEGAEKAFQRLQRETHKITKDMSILAWCNTNDEPSCQLARSPTDFQKFAEETNCGASDEPWRFDGTMKYNERALEIRSRMMGGLSSRVLVEVCRRPRGQGRPDECIGIYMHPKKGSYTRIDTKTLVRYSSRGGTFYTFDFDCAVEISNTAKSGLAVKYPEESSSEFVPLQNPIHRSPSSVLGFKRARSDSVGPPQRCVLAGLQSAQHSTLTDDSDGDDSETISTSSWSYLNSPSVDETYGADEFHQCTASTSLASELSAFWNREEGQLKHDPENYPDMQQIVSSIVETAYQDFCAGVSSMRSRPASDDQALPQGKRVKRDGQIRRGDNNAGLVEGSQRYFVCPFYARAPRRYEQCLLKHGLESIDQVREHLDRDHRRPPYCPRCRLLCKSNDERDGHIQLGMCELLPITKIEGLGVSDVERMTEQDEDARNICLGDVARWHRLAAFTDSTSKIRIHRSPYLCEGFELDVARLRTFWAGCSHLYVQKPRSCNDSPDDRGSVVQFLKERALQGLIDRMSQGRGTGLRPREHGEEWEQ